jgi:Na+/phosphate symporter
MIVVLSLLVCLVGLIIYLVADKPKPADIGRGMFFIGLFVFLWNNSGPILAIVKR